MWNAVDLPDDMDALKTLLIAAEARNLHKQDRIDRLELLVAAFKQAMFRRKSEKIDPDQFESAVEDIETKIAMIHAEDEPVEPTRSHPVKPRDLLPGSFLPVM